MIYTNVEIRALSWRQPFASLMLPPHNKIETRTWNTKYRGLVLICASKKAYPWDSVLQICGLANFNTILELGQNELLAPDDDGHAIAIGALVECRPMQLSDEHETFVRYHPDLYCHVYHNVRPIEPFPFKGRQGWTILDQATKELITLKNSK